MLNLNSLLRRPLVPLALGLAALAPTALGADAGASESASMEERLRRLETAVNALREENAALRREAGRPEKVSVATPAPATGAPTLRVTGDIRFRFSSTMYEAKEAATRDQFYDQLHLGFFYSLSPAWEAGVRFSAGDLNTNFAGNPLSAQFTVADNGSRKYAFIDQMFFRWKPSLGPDAQGAITVGKSDNLFYVPSRILFDSDYMPEGITEELAIQASKRDRLWFAAGQYMLDDLTGSARDPWMLAARAKWDAKWDDNWSTSLGIGQIRITNGSTLTAANVANNNRGNTRTANGILPYAYRPFYAEASVTHYLGQVSGYNGNFPVTLHADGLHNPGAPARRNGFSAGLTLGKAGKAGQWEIGLRHQYIEADAWWEEMLDGDYGAYYRSVPLGWNTDATSLAGGHGGGTNLRSDSIRTSYSPTDYLLFSANLFMNDLVTKIPAGTTDTGAKRLQLEGLIRF